MVVVLSRKGGAGTGGGTASNQNLSVGLSTGGNTLGNTGVATGSRFVLVASGPLTASQATAAGASTITLSAAAQTVQTQGVLSMGVSTGGNTLGNTGVDTGSRFVIVGSNGITASQATAAGATTVTLSGVTQSVQTQGVLSLGVSTGGNTSGNTTVNTGSRFVLAGGNNVTVSQATAAGATTVTISAASQSVQSQFGGTVSMWPDQPASAVGSAVTGTFFTTNATTARTTLTALMFPIAVPQFLSANYMQMHLMNTMSSSATDSNWSFTMGMSLGIYTLNVNTLSMVSSFSHNYNLSYASAANSTNASMTFNALFGSGTNLSSSITFSSNNAGATGPWSSISNIKLYPFASGAFSLSAGQYFGGWAYSSATAGANLASISQLYLNAAATSAINDVGRNIASLTAQWPLVGSVTLTQTDTAMAATVATADITTVSNNLAQRIPIIRMISQL